MKHDKMDLTKASGAAVLEAPRAMAQEVITPMQDQYTHDPTKTCNSCGEEKSLTDFHRHRASRDGHCRSCKACACARTRAWKAAHPDQKKVSDRRVYERNRERYIEQAAQWAAANPERRREIRQAWSARNPEKARASLHKMLATFDRDPERRKEYFRQAASRHRERYPRTYVPRLLWAKIVAASDFRCVYCGAKSDDLEVDHVIPVSRGGGTDESNLIPSCHSCNIAKSGAAPEEWVTEQFGVEGLGRVIWFLENRTLVRALYGVEISEVAA